MIPPGFFPSGEGAFQSEYEQLRALEDEILEKQRRACAARIVERLQLKRESDAEVIYEVLKQERMHR